MAPKHREMPSSDVASFVKNLDSSKRIVALLGAGLSASSGLPTFRGAGGFWRTHDATTLATPEAFYNDPGLVWQFYSYRRHMALNAKPNRAHLALAELARKNANFITLSQNVDGLSPRAGHPEGQLKLLHGNLFDVKCWDENRCGYIRRNDFTDPIVPALALPEDQQAARASLAKAARVPKVSASMEAAIAWKQADVADQTPSDTNASTEGPPSPTAAVPRDEKVVDSACPEQVASVRQHALLRGADISDINIPIPIIRREDLPQCPSCKKHLLRPGVVWFGESLPEDVMGDVEDWFDQPEKIDLMLVIGTSSKVYPAAGYTELARQKGARVAVINMDKSDARQLSDQDWFFEGDAAAIVPDILKSVIGETPDFTAGQESSL